MSQELNIVYSDEWDKEHYPIQQHHLDTLKAVLDEKLDIFIVRPSQELKIEYFSTIHGAIFDITRSGNITDTNPRVSRYSMEFLMKLKNFRWVGFSVQGPSFTIQLALTHQEPKE